MPLVQSLCCTPCIALTSHSLHRTPCIVLPASHSLHHTPCIALPASPPALPVLQSRIFHTAFTSNENMLVCAPTGKLGAGMRCCCGGCHTAGCGWQAATCRVPQAAQLWVAAAGLACMRRCHAMPWQGSLLTQRFTGVRLARCACKVTLGASALFLVWYRRGQDQHRHAERAAGGEGTPICQFADQSMLAGLCATARRLPVRPTQLQFTRLQQCVGWPTKMPPPGPSCVSCIQVPYPLLSVRRWAPTWQPAASFKRPTSRSCMSRP